MKISDTARPVDDTEENLAICRKYCGACPTFRNNRLFASVPNTLFCARGRSSVSSTIKQINCFCPACELFTKCGLTIGYFCAKK
jgi:hypothetical protein